MKIRPYNYKRVEEDNWDKILQNPRDISTMSFQTGNVTINLKGTLNPDHPLFTEDEDDELEVPILAHWVHHRKMGDFLLDTGLDASYITDKFGGLKGSAVDKFRLEENENIAYHLEKHCIKLKKVFISHLHSDHAAGVRELPKDIPYILAQGEYDEYHPEVHGDFLEGLEELYEIDFTNAQNIPPLGQSVDLLGDGSLWAIKTPGHTPNHISFLINGLKGPILLTMDAAFIHENLRRGIAPRDYTWDARKAQETLEWIIEFLKQYTQCRVWVGHEYPIH